MTNDSPKAQETKGQPDKVDPEAALAETPRPAPRWQPDATQEEDDDDLFNDMPV